MSQQKKKENVLKNYALRIALNTASHPVEYAKILIQVRIRPIILLNLLLYR